MKKGLFTPFFCILLLVLPAVLQAQDTGEASLNPFLEVTFRNYREASGRISAVVDAVQPGMGAQIGVMLPMVLGIPGLAGVEQDKPVHMVMGLDTANRLPVIAVFVPAVNGELLKTSLNPQGMLMQTKGMPNHVEVIGSNLFILLNTNRSGVSSIQEKYISSAKTWLPDLDDPEHLITIGYVMEPLRQKALVGLQQIQMLTAMGIAMGGGWNSGMDPVATAEIMTGYFDVLRMILSFTDRVYLYIDSDGLRLTTVLEIHPIKGTPLAQAVTKPEMNLTDVVGWLDPKAQMSFASCFQKDSFLVTFGKKYARLSLKMQGVAEENMDEMKAAFDETIDLMIPSRTVFSGGFTKEGFSFKGVYKLEKGRAGGFLGVMKRLVEGMAKSAGKDSVLLAAGFEPNVRSIGTVPVSRITFKYNLKHPLMQAQQVQGMKMFKLDNLVYEYAVINDLVAMGSADGFDEYVGMVTANSGVGEVDPETVAIGHLNLFSLIKGISEIMPAMNPLYIDSLKDVDTVGTNIVFKADLSGKAVGTMNIPMNLLKALGTYFRTVRNGGTAPAPEKGAEVKELF